MCGVELSEEYFQSSPGLALHYENKSRLIRLAEKLCDDCIEVMKQVLKEKSVELKQKRIEAGWKTNADT